MKIDCQYCHSAVDKSRFATIPSTAVCMNCHSVARKNKPEILKLAKYYAEKKPIEWKRIHKLADFAYFNHSVHVNKGINCTKCHGDIDKMDVVGQMKSFTMGACLDCHRNAHLKLPEIAGQIKNGPENCAACHR
jgi:hypothetical protein